MTQQPGVLYIVATPIGNLEDFTPRARRILAEVDLVAAEDTRHSGQLLKRAGIDARLLALHDYNETQRTPELVAKLLAGQSVALISDAGTPLISDPGYGLVHAAHEAGVTVTPIPGPCALITALCASGLPTDRFVFEGFPPSKKTARQTALAALVSEPRTIVFYESVHRLADSIADMVQAFGSDRPAVIARELTKLHESIHSGRLSELKTWAETDAYAGKGEVVVLVGGATEPLVDTAAEHVLDILLTELPVKQAAALAAKLTGAKRNDVYKRALQKATEDE